MSKARNAGVAGGVLLIALWGGLGAFLGKGKGKGSQKADQKKAVQRAQPRTRIQPSIRKTAHKTVKRVASVPVVPSRTFRYVVRMTFIHPVLSDGTLSPKTISIEELLQRGREAQKAKRELHLSIRGDARAKWLNRLKKTLKENHVAYSLANDF